MNNQSSGLFVARLCLFLLAACLLGNVNAYRIINGVDTTIDIYPEIVQLSYKDFRMHQCSGFLVSDRYVVTAAHCVTGDKGNGKFLKVIANTTYATEGGIEREIEAFYVPDGFDQRSRNWDMAVIKLKEPFPLGKGIQVAKLCDKLCGSEERIQIAGWGYTQPTGTQADQLMTETVSTISDKKCKERLSKIDIDIGNNTFKNYNLMGTMSCGLAIESDENTFAETMSCGPAKGHVDACRGDSGGPAYIGREVCGIVSCGFECGRGKLPSFYTSMAKARKFINAALSHNASDVEGEKKHIITLSVLAKAQKIVLDDEVDEDRIINGVNTTIDEFPEIVQLSDKDHRVHECGAFLVSDRHVVTAAHCVAGDKGNGNYLKVIANTTYATEGGIEREIEAFYVPDGFEQRSRNWDVAVIKLKEPYALGKGVKVAKLCDYSWGKQERLRIAGWGYTQRKGALADRLMTATVSTISDHKCKERLSNIEIETEVNTVETYNFTDTMSCALAKGQVDACKGDSGGPAYIDKEVCGIVSWGFECGRGKMPSFYTSIHKARNFINAALCHNASDVEYLKELIPGLLCPDKSKILFETVSKKHINIRSL